MEIITKNRREFIAKIVSDLGKTIFAVGLASYFFEKFPGILKVFLAVACLIFFIGSIFIQPKEKGD
jgi:hypothetical protein